MKWLVYHYGGLGDFITIFPLLSFVKRQYRASVSLLGKTAFGALAQKNGLVDSFLDADSSSHLFLFLDNSSTNELETFLNGYTHILLFVNNDSPLQKNAEHYSTAKTFSLPIIPETVQPVSDYHLSKITVDSIPFHLRIPDLSRLISSRSKEKQHLRPTSQNPIVALHSGSGSPLKKWAMENFMILADQLRQRGCSIIWFSGEAESLPQPLISDMHFSCLPLPECAEILSACTVYCGNDSGFSHLAAASGCPSVVLFGPSDENIWSPRGRNGVSIISKRDAATCHPQSSTTGTFCTVPSSALPINQKAGDPRRDSLDKIMVKEVLNAIIAYIPHLNNC